MSYVRGMWTPEVTRDDWHVRGERAPLRESWLGIDGADAGALTRLSRLPAEEKLVHLWVLAADIGEAQRDGLMYFNQLEWLKNQVQPIPRIEPRPSTDPNDQWGDAVVDRMREWGFASVDRSPDAGGPPLGQSPRKWREVFGWLFGKIKDVGLFLLNAIQPFMTLVKDFNVSVKISAIAIGALPPSLGIEFEPNEVDDTMAWGILKRFLSEMLDGTTRGIA